MLFSATMTETLRELATVSLKDPVRIFLNQSTAVAVQLDQEFVRIRAHREGDREAILAALLMRSFRRRTIVFLPTKKDCHRMHILLGLIGVKCAELHGDMNQAQRLEALTRFTDADALRMEQMSASQAASADLPPPVDVLLATDLASRGLDIPGVLTVSLISSFPYCFSTSLFQLYFDMLFSSNFYSARMSMALGHQTKF